MSFFTDGQSWLTQSPLMVVDIFNTLIPVIEFYNVLIWLVVS